MVTKTLGTGSRTATVNGAGGAGGAGTAASTRSTACRCGQQLDCCERQHCPRCGRTLHG